MRQLALVHFEDCLGKNFSIAVAMVKFFNDGRPQKVPRELV